MTPIGTKSCCAAWPGPAVPFGRPPRLEGGLQAKAALCGHEGPTLAGLSQAAGSRLTLAQCQCCSARNVHRPACYV